MRQFSNTNGKMPIQTPQWTDFLVCPICCNDYDYLHNPISLGCGHTLCKLCLSKLQRKQCPYDQTNITIDINDLPINYALLQLVSANGVNTTERSQTQLNLQSRLSLSADHFHHYVKASKHVEDIALFLKPFSSGLSSTAGVNVLSRPMQRKLVMLLNCQLLEEEGRTRALKAARSLGERTVTELIIQHQNPQQLSTNLWAAVRARGCQFLGPAMQEEVLKLVLLALEDGSALSRKVLVMFVVQRLEPHFPQASKTSIGHVVQLLYRASCFVVSKREGDSSLMKLKEEFRTYDALRREHDAQIVEIATEAGLRIAPDQWSALLYGDTAHKSHMQSIIDKLQNPQSFAQSVQELVIALQRTNDPGNLCMLRPHLEYLANMDVNADFGAEIWKAVSTALEAALVVVSGLVSFIKTHGCRKASADVGANVAVHASKYKISVCRDLAVKGTCPRGISCTFAHSEEELVKYRSKHRKFQRKESDSAPPLLKLVNSNNIPVNNNNNHIVAHNNINLDVRGSSNLDDSYYMVGRDIFADKSDRCFCEVPDFTKFGSQQIIVQPTDTFLSNSSFCGNALPMADTARRITSSQYLVAMNHRKQQIISELQQVLSKVQNQYSAPSYDRMQSAVAFIPNDHLVNSPYILSPTDHYRTALNLTTSQSDAMFPTHVPTNKLNLRFNNSVIPGSNLIDIPILATPFDNTSSLVNTASEESLPPSDFIDWNTNYTNSKPCHSCGTSETSSLADPKAQQQVNVCNLTDEVPESLLLESFKLQDKLRGLKKQITDIKDKTYEEGIINNLRALELRLECELAEEEEKFWPLQNNEQT